MNSPGGVCSTVQPMFCSKEKLAKLYVESSSQCLSGALINSSSLNIVDGVNWSFDPGTLTIWNNRFWKGFYPLDYSFENTILMYGFGFYKRFWQSGGDILGETHPFLSNIHALNRSEDTEYAGTGKVILLRYRDFPYNAFFDLMKVVSPDSILGDAFLSTGNPPSGTHIFHFALSRRYFVEFMTQEDCRFIFSHKARQPEANDVLGMWDLRLVSDAALSPPILRFGYYLDHGVLKTKTILCSTLPLGSSKIGMSDEIRMGIDPVSWLMRNEVRMVNGNFMVGMLGDAKNPIFDALQHSRGFLMHLDSGPVLPYALWRVREK